MKNILSHTDDAQALLTALRAGDAKAFAELYDVYIDDLFRFTENRLKHREDAKEIVQDVFAELWEKRETLHIHTSVKAVLFAMCRNKVLNYFRDKKISDRYVDHFITVLANEFDEELERSMDLNDLKNTIEEHMKPLPENCKVVFRMSRFEHLPSDLIAQRMRISHRTVENYLTRTLKHLRRSLVYP